MPETREIEISSIVVPSERARATFTEEQDKELEASIKTHGFTVPILVAPQADGKYMLIDGEHRLEIAKRLGYTRVPAVVCSGDPKTVSMLNILANTARGTQDPVGVAQALKRAADSGASEEELAAATGHTVEWVRFYLALNDLPDHIKKRLQSGELKVGHIREALRLGVPVEIDSALQSAVIHNWTVEDLHYYVERRLPVVKHAYSSEAKEPPPPPPTPEVAAEIVMYQECMGCKRQIDRRMMRMPVLCEECLTLLRYVTDQLGNPKDAMKTIYDAVSFYQNALEKAKMPVSATVVQPAVETSSVPSSSQAQQPPSAESLQFDRETLELARKLKALKQAGLI